MSGRPPSSLPWGGGYPELREGSLRCGGMWLKGRQETDGAEGLWRIHDDLYDLSDWIHKHPGGSDWLILTKGTDITEMFESHHLFDTAEKYLKSFRVRSAKSPRNSPYTFLPNGFYRTLKKNCSSELLRLKASGGAFFSKALADFLVFSTLFCAIGAARYSSYILAAVSGTFLGLLVNCAHNFVHQRDNFRMYYLDLSLLSSREWRITHSLSHHHFTNTLLDLEISVLEPLVQLLPWEGKTLLARYGYVIYGQPIFFFSFYGSFMTRMLDHFVGSKLPLRKADLLPLVIPGLMILVGGASLWQALVSWTCVVLFAGSVFANIGINAAHHHPDIFHEGDAPREDMDWGLHQLDAVRDRELVNKSNALALVSFGHHGLHHLFPTLDHCLLENLYPVFQKTCEKFGIQHTQYTQTELVYGQYQQVARTKPNPLPPGVSKQS